MEINEKSRMLFKCPECKNKLEAAMVHHPGGVNDYGTWVIKCDSCSAIFGAYVGRDVNDSSLTKGGEILERMDKEVYNDEEIEKTIEKLKKEHGKTNKK